MFVQMVNFKEFLNEIRQIVVGGWKLSISILFCFFLMLTPSWPTIQYGFFTTYDHLLIRTAKISAEKKPVKGTILTSVRHKKLSKVLILICYLNNCNKIDLKFHEVVLKQDRYSYIFQRLKRRMHAVPRRDFLFY